MSQINTKLTFSLLLIFFSQIIIFIQCSDKSPLKLTKNELDKLDPRFQTVLAEELPNLQLTKASPRIKPAAIREDGTNVYNAIIYTTNPDTLKAVGIQVNSVLPKFVTARVTSLDLVRIIKLDAVKYIDAGEKLYPQQE